MDNLPENQKNIGGISEEFQLEASTQNSVQFNQVEQPEIKNLISFNDFDAIPSVKDLKPSPTAKILSRNKNKIFASTPVMQGVKYYLVLFNDNSGARGSFVSSNLLTAGERKTIQVQAGVKYHWIAYSYNSDLNDLPQVTSSNLVVSMGKNKDFLHASGVTNVISATQPTFLSILINHMLTRVGIEINTRGMFADIESAEVELANTTLSVANFDLTDQTISASGTSYGSGIKIGNFVKSPDNREDIKVGFLYIPPRTTNLDNFQVKLNNLKILLDDEAQALGNPSRTFVYPSGGVSAPVFTTNLTNLGKGRSKVFKIDLVESPLIVSTSFKYSILKEPLTGLQIWIPSLTPAVVRWARSNLYYSSAGDPYRFQHINYENSDRKFFFPWGSANPFVFGKNDDPCKLVYPYNVWKMPSARDFYATIGGSSTDVNVLGLLNVNLDLGLINLLGLDFNGVGSNNRNITTRYVEYIPSNGRSIFYNVGNDDKINNRIRFNFNGASFNLSLVESLVNLELGKTKGKIARLWTSTANTNLLGLAGVGAIAYTGVTAGGYADP